MNGTITVLNPAHDPNVIQNSSLIKEIKTAGAYMVPAIYLDY
jgi:hypothetical protein